MPGPLYRDPWAAREAWRKSPIFSNRAMFRYVLLDRQVVEVQSEADMLGACSLDSEQRS